jgi:hypothetical protein
MTEAEIKSVVDKLADIARVHPDQHFGIDAVR